MINAGWRALRYLDDFFVVLETNPLADEFEKFFSALCKTLGLNVNELNIRGTLAEFLGIEIDACPKINC